MDIQTAGISLNAQQNSSNVITGYTVNDTVNVTVRTIGRAGSAIDAAVAAAGDSAQIQNVSFSYSHPAGIVARAQRQAVASARSEADRLARAAGLKVTQLRSMSDTTNQAVTGYGPSPALPAPGTALSTPVNPGQQQTSVDVSTVWILS